MLGLGWSEMLVIAVVVLIVVGPKDLPVMLRNLGRAMGTVRKMSNEFRREIDKAIAADEFRDAKKSISDPLKQTTQDLTREFNSLRNGKVEPSGKLAPADPAKESVVDEIRAQAGMKPLPAPVTEPITPPNAATTTAQQAAPLAATASTKVKAAPRKPKAAAKPATSNGTTTTAKPKPAAAKAKPAAAKAKPATAKAEPATAKPAAAKATAKPKAAKPAAAATDATAPAPAKRTRKPATPNATPPAAGED
ncbi:Sec-independent protein translocase protein TatB [Pelagibacterium luteolum]|uniref:Sec-independent protein translocase protein TatB n=1 Tax=Pelagibacterium luteolum TaxID=440168 RepID=A0A1G7VZD2_9HYPH|nr:Sec-independent protein translocase protein TatB [Pelagibacterium luteolum]SDG65102.1 sec-independent protein translocase protein TatB [Pelagibacterium luteolum]